MIPDPTMTPTPNPADVLKRFGDVVERLERQQHVRRLADVAGAALAAGLSESEVREAVSAAIRQQALSLV